MSGLKGLIRMPRVIMMTSFLSWSGKRYHVPVGGSLSEFTSRAPHPKETEVYKIENKFHTCSTQVGMEGCLVGTGLIYGGKGFDMHNLFK
jgi:hypothetical protein